MIYCKEKSSEISFPLGGIGAGCIGLTGNGRLSDWEIFNVSNKNSLLGYTHFCVSAAGKYRLLQGECFAPYTGKYRKGDDNTHHGFGWGVENELLAGLPHFRDHLFKGTFPTAEVEFSGEEKEFPLTASLTAWSPFIPGMERESSTPCAVLEYTLKNIGSETVEAVLTGVMKNPWRTPGHKNTISDHTCLTLSSAEGSEVSLSVLEAPENCSGQEYLYRGGWMDALEMYLNELKAGGRFAPRTYTDDPAGTANRIDHGLLAVHFTLAPGESRCVRFLITWHMAELRRNHWSRYSEDKAEKTGVPTQWKNYYATQWQDSKASAAELIRRFDELRKKTFLFRDLLHNTDLAPAIIDGASSSLSTLRSPTCLRLEDGTFYGWEGVGTAWGSCEGSCMHVWNYTQAAPFLFPALERSMQESHLKYSVDETGGVHFRLQLPLGLKAYSSTLRPCADGHFGLVMKFFRDWKISGDDSWLKKYYPVLKSVMMFVWSDKNSALWDPGKSGLLSGRQHHTLDMELFGPNGWLQGFYLGALSAMAKMAEAVGDKAFAEECLAIFERGRKAAATLFNGEHFIQKIDIKDASVLDPWPEAKQAYWNDEKNEIKYQIGEGLEIDSCLGDLFASLWGIGPVFDPEMTRSTLDALFRRNFLSAADLENPWRCFAVNDEKGVCICTWEKNKPAVPLPYNSEMMNGFEWAFASHLLAVGEYEKAALVAAAIRERYDGRKRNPWNEFECGSNYARSMAAFGMLPAALGFSFDLTQGMLGFLPAVKDMKRCFWSLGTVWGEYRSTSCGAEIFIADGGLLLKKLRLPFPPRTIKVKGVPVSFTQKEEAVELEIQLSPGDTLEIEK